MTTIAGTGAAGYSGDKGLATSARFNETVGIALDASGNIYVSDAYYHVIRVITKSTGIITTVAGTGRVSDRTFDYYTGDGGLATSATLYGPVGLALDASGNIYVTDLFNNVIRKITNSTGIITTVAGTGRQGNGGYGYYTGDGGLATNATLNGPEGIAFDASGNIYVSDSYNNVIRKITNSTGIITTVAGTGRQDTTGYGYYTGDGGLATDATLYRPQGIAFDASGNMYVAEFYNNVIRKITKSTGIITTVAGTGRRQSKVRVNLYTGDGGLATNATLKGPAGLALDASGNIYFTDVLNNVIRKVTKSTGIITTVAGRGIRVYYGDGGRATVAALFLPVGLALDASGNIYFTDVVNNVIRKITKSTGIITTVAGTGAHGSMYNGGPTSSNLNKPFGIAIDSAGTAYFADSDSHQVRSFSTLSTSTQSLVSSSAIPNHMSVGLHNPVWWISASLLLLMW